MAVRKRTYHAYSGPLTDARTRFMILFRYSWANVMRSRFAVAYLVVCLLVAVVFGAIVYVSHSAALLAFFGAGPQAAGTLVDSSFFYHFIRTEVSLALILTAFAGPGLISPDLANQALPLYFCRPLSRAEYVLGKFSVLAVLISVITWLPGLTLFALQCDLSGWGWAASHLWIARAIFLGSLVIILVYSALALALSAWFRRKVLAGGVLLGVFFVGAGLGQTFDATLGTRWGGLIDIGGLIGRVVAGLFGVQLGRNRVSPISPGMAGVALLGVCAFCLYLIERRIRAREVVRR
jgi:ABC-2 type transport system permease protein